jgi:hypothetical protein
VEDAPPVPPKENVVLNKCNCSEPISKTLHVSSMWRIRQINLIKYAHERERSSHILSNLLGSEQLQISNN